MNDQYNVNNIENNLKEEKKKKIIRRYLILMVILVVTIIVAGPPFKSVLEGEKDFEEVGHILYLATFVVCISFTAPVLRDNYLKKLERRKRAYYEKNIK